MLPSVTSNRACSYATISHQQSGRNYATISHQQQAVTMLPSVTQSDRNYATISDSNQAVPSVTNNQAVTIPTISPLLNSQEQISPFQSTMHSVNGSNLSSSLS